MTSTNVSQIPVPANVMNEPQKSAAKSNGDGTEFIQVMNSSLVKSPQSDPKSTSMEVSAPVKTETKQEAPSKENLSYDRPTKKIPEVKSASDTATPEETEKAIEAINVFADQVKEVIEDTMEASEEEITEAMENHGLTLVDLADPSATMKVLAEIVGEDDSAALLLDDTISTVTEQIVPIAEEMLQTVGVSDVEGLKDFISVNDFAVDAKEAIITPIDLGPDGEVTGEALPLNGEEAAPVFMADQDGSYVAPQPIAEQPLSPREDGAAENEALMPGIELPKEAAAAAEKETEPAVADDAQKVEGKTDVPVMVNRDMPTSNSESDTFLKQQNQNSSDRDLVFKETREPAAAPTVTVANDTSVSFQDTVASTVEHYTDIDPRDLMEQVVTQTRTMVTESFSSMELELHPATLGKMYLQVSENDGHITAKLFIENDNVKNAMETQLVALKEQWEAQGMKVNAVEVTLGTKEFEEQLDQGTNASLQNETNSSQNEGAADDSSQGGSRMRNLNLNQLEDMPTDLTEEELLTANMMRDMGNSVNFTA